MKQKELKDRTLVSSHGQPHCCSARSHMELIDRRRNRESVHAVPTVKQRHLVDHRKNICRCCCRWLIRDSPPWASSLLYSQRTLRAALASIAKIRKDDDVDEQTLFDSVTLISSDDDNEKTINHLKRKQYKQRSNKHKQRTKEVPETKEEDTGPSTGNRDYDEWMRQKTQYKRFFYIESMIGKSKAKETTEAETKTDQSNIDPEKTQTNIAPSQESATKTQSNIPPRRESATKTQSIIAPSQKSATKTQSNNVTSQDTSVESEAYKTIANPLLHIANIMEQKYKNVVFATSEKKAKSMAEDALELALKVTSPLTAENVALHEQMQDFNSGPSTNALLNAPIIGQNMKTNDVRRLVKLQNCISITPVQPNVQNPDQIAPKPKLVYLGKSVNPTAQPSTRPVYKLLQKAKMPQVLQNTSPSTDLNNVVFNPAVNMPSVLKKYSQNYTPLEQAQNNLTKAKEFILPTTEPATVTPHTSAAATNRSLLKSVIQNVESNRSLPRSVIQKVESNRSLLRSAVQDVESNIIKEVPCICTKNCTQKSKKADTEDVYFQIPASGSKQSEPFVVKLPNVMTNKQVEQNLGITEKKYNISNQNHTVIKIKRDEKDTSTFLHKEFPLYRTLCRDGKPIARVRAPFVSNIVEEGHRVSVLTCGSNLNSERKPMEDNSAVSKDDTNASGRNSPDVVMVTAEPEVVDLTDDNGDTMR